MTEPVIVQIVVEPEAQGLELPRYETEFSAGMDLRAAIDEELILQPGCRCLVTTGLRLAIPPGYEAQVRPRSGLAIKHGITVANAPGTIDADYRGVLQVGLINQSQEPFTICRGDRIAQLIVAPVARAQWSVVDTLDDTTRGHGGFGHTGTN